MSTNTGTILIVDDDALNRLVVRTCLDEQGYQVDEATDGQQALDMLHNAAYDVVLLDLEMPVMDGYETARQIKARWPACRVVAFSVHSYRAARQKAVAAGVDEFIEKGASLNEILQKIGAL